MWQTRLKAAGLRVELNDDGRFRARGQRKATRLEVTGSREGETWTWVLSAQNKYIPSDLSIVAETGRSWLTDLFGGQDHVIGDPILDDLARIQGPPDRLLAALDDTTRERVRSLLERDGAVSDRTVQLTVSTDAARPTWLSDRVLDLSRLAGRLAVHPKRVSQGLIRAVDRDPLPGIRTEAFRILMQEHAPRVPERLLTEARLLPLLDQLSYDALVVALEALGRVGSATSLPVIAPYARFPRGNNATRKAARRAGKAIAERTAPEGGLQVVPGPPSQDGGLALSGEHGGLSTAEDEP